LSQFNFFHNNWLDCTQLLQDDVYNSAKDECSVNLTSSFFNSLKFDVQSVQTYAKEAALLTASQLGNKPALCLSGGVDSQCAVLSFLNAGLNFDVVFMKFKDGLNAHDLQYAQNFCKTNNIRLIEIEFNVLNFLARENYDYAVKYNCPSPHFTCHFKFFDILQTLGYTGIVCGGTNPLQTENNVWGSNYSRNNLKYINYVNTTGFPCQANFLSFYPNLSWALSLLTEKSNFNNRDASKLSDYTLRQQIEQVRYDLKVRGMIRSGFTIKPQISKFTGFELIKKKLEKETGDGWAFEKLYRQPLEKTLIKNTNINQRYTVFHMPDEVRETLKVLYDNNFTSSNATPSWITV